MSGRGTQRPSGPPANESDYDPLDPADARYARSVDHDERPSLDKILPELLRRGLEAGRGPLGRVGESFVPKEFAQSVVAQLGDARSGIVKAVALEIGRFLRDADIASEVRKVLVGLDVEAQVKLRFTQREDGRLVPSVEIGGSTPGAPAPPAPPTATPATPATPATSATSDEADPARSGSGSGADDA